MDNICEKVDNALQKEKKIQKCARIIKNCGCTLLGFFSLACAMNMVNCYQANDTKDFLLNEALVVSTALLGIATHKATKNVLMDNENHAVYNIVKDRMTDEEKAVYAQNEKSTLKNDIKDGLVVLSGLPLALVHPSIGITCCAAAAGMTASNKKVQENQDILNSVLNRLKKENHTRSA